MLSADQKTTQFNLLWQDVDVLQLINATFAPISSLTNILVWEIYAIVSAVLPNLDLLNNNLLKESENDKVLTKNLKIKVKRQCVIQMSLKMTFLI